MMLPLRGFQLVLPPAAATAPLCVALMASVTNEVEVGIVEGAGEVSEEE